MNAALEAQLISRQNVAQGLAELPGPITTVLSRSQVPTRRMLVDPKGSGKPPVFSGREEHFYVGTKKVENNVSGVFPNVRGSLAFAAESQDVVTAATVAIGVLELGVETSAEIDGQLFVVLSALTEGESFDVVMSAGGDHGFESWRKLRGRWKPDTAGRARSLLCEILSPTRARLPELMCAIEKMEDRVRRYSSRRDAQGNAHTLAEGIRMSSLEASLPDDLEKHVQLNGARLISYGVLRREIKTYCEFRGHANARNTNQKGSSHSGGDDPMDIGAFGKGKGKQGKGKHGKCKGKGKQGQQGQHGQDKDKSKDKRKDSVECWNCGKRGHDSKDCWSKKNTNKGGSKGKHKPKNADTHNLDSKPSIVEPEVEIDELNMSYLDVDALKQQPEKMRGSEWIKIGVDTGAGKTAWPQSITYGTTIPGDSFPHGNWRNCPRWQTKACCGLRRLGIQSRSSRCSTTGVQTIVVCWRVHNDGWSHCVVW